MTKADQARELLAAGMSIADTARKVGAHYSQIHSVWKGMPESGNLAERVEGAKRTRSVLRPKAPAGELKLQFTQYPGPNGKILLVESVPATPENHNRRRQLVARSQPPVASSKSPEPSSKPARTRKLPASGPRPMKVEDPLEAAWHKAQADAEEAKAAGNEQAHRAAIRRLIEMEKRIGERAMGRLAASHSTFGRLGSLSRTVTP